MESKKITEMEHEIIKDFLTGIISIENMKENLDLIFIGFFSSFFSQDLETDKRESIAVQIASLKELLNRLEVIKQVI